MYLQVDRKTKIITLNPNFYSKYPLFLRNKKNQNRKPNITLGANYQI